MKKAPAWMLSMILVVSSGCMSANSGGGNVESGFGNRETDGEGGRSTIVITSVPNVNEYVVSPVPFESADIRVGTRENGTAPVEILVKGAFPDSCTELHGANQTRTNSEVIVNIQARRPVNAVCASVMRPYRFYLTIDGTFESGRYTLDLNGVRQVFVVN
ncbi:MAG: hypothetical protein E2O84_00845 [Bacteroidetes bacterium]|nr:MAG: hypothetical protein E2O84_00845 [Bacteroidota bacterium]